MERSRTSTSKTSQPCRWRHAVALSATLLLSGGSAHAGPELGREATREEIAGWDISIPPAGLGLPSGRGTSVEGQIVFLEKCASCHGVEGQGSTAEPLVGGVGTLNSSEPVKTVGSYWPYATTLFDYVRRAMPYDRPMSLSSDEVYAISAYILFLNGIIPEGTEMNSKTLPSVEMPNRHGFVDHSSPPR